MADEIEIGPPAELAESFARRAEREAERALSERGRFALALSGGSAAVALLPALAAAALDWRRVDLAWIDERAVPPDHPESNFGLAWRAGFEALPLDPAKIHRLRGEADDLAAAARDADQELRAALGSPPRLDFAFLGVGPDGHVASLFPGARTLDETERWVIAIDDSPKPPPRRLSVTLPLLATVDLVVLAALGAEKAPAVRAAAEEPGSPLPVARALRLARRRLFLLDPAAASLLAGG